jgi:xylulokinase
MASRMMALDLHQLRWADDLLAEAGIPARLLAPLVPSGTRLGPVTPDAARETGLPGTAQVATGGHDHDCGALAVGVVAPGEVLDSLGTAEAIFVPLERPLPGPELARQGFSQGVHTAAGRYYVHGGIYTSGASVDWLRGILGAQSATDHAALIEEAAQVPPGSLGVHFVPHLRLANPPRDDPRARGVFAGLTTDATRGALYRAVLEGLAYESRLSLDALLAQPDVAPLRRFTAIGGSSRNRLFMGIKASVLNQIINVADVPEATSLGAAVLGGLGAGIYRDVAHALATLDLTRAAITPVADHVAGYERRYREVYARLYPALHDLHHAIDAIERT